jgi:5'(3')-deoxyribonucleotidase
MTLSDGERKVIAIDLDDTLSYTNLTICKWHNDNYGTNMTLDDFHSYYYWKNPGWGTPAQAISKVRDFLLSPMVNEIPPIPSAQHATKHLKDAGYTLVVITARMYEISNETVNWLENHFPGIFDGVYFTSAFQQKPLKAVWIESMDIQFTNIRILEIDVFLCTLSLERKVRCVYMLGL